MTDQKTFDDQVHDIIAKCKAALQDGQGRFAEPEYALDVIRVEVDRLSRLIAPMVGLSNPESDTMAAYFKDAVGVVEATREEQHQLWWRNNERIDHVKTWKCLTEGFLVQVGSHAGSCITASISSAIIDGQKVIFVEGASVVVHHDMIRKWVTCAMNAHSGRTDAQTISVATLIAADPWRWTDATNFHNVLR